MNFISLEGINQAGVKQPSENNKKSKKLPKNKLDKSKRSKNGLRRKRFPRRKGGIIYIGHIPHGFYEDEMKSYFNQFGKVLTTCVSRSSKTGRSRGYGFVQFEDEEVAKIAAETMNNYLMYNKIIKCRYIPPEERKKNIYDSKISTHNYPRQKNRKIDLKNKENALLKLNQETYLQKVQKKINQFKTFFEKNGVDFSFQINDKSSQDNSTNSESEKCETKSSSNQHEESENETNDINGVLEIDESDDEISFKTPPQVKKVIKKSLNSPAVSQKDLIQCRNSLMQKISKSKSNPKKIQNQQVSKKNTKLASLKEAQVNKNRGKNSKKVKSKKLLEKTLTSNKKSKKGTSKKITSAAVKKTKKEKVKKNIDVLKSKKEKLQTRNVKSKEK